MARTDRLYLIDAMALAYRSYFAFIQRPLINSKGQNTSAIFGFVNYLNKILTEEAPEYIAVVSDTSAPTFRHEAYKEYKATRQRMPEDLASQLDLLKEVVRAYRIPYVEQDGFEADDIIGTLAVRAAAGGMRVFMVTADKDFMQLVSSHIKMYKPGRVGDDVEIVSSKEVKVKFGVGPEKVVDVLGLIGDTSDNVPGVPGVGEKTAIPLVQKFGSMEGIYEHLDKIPQKGLRAKLETHRELAFLSKHLVTINTAVPLTVDIPSLRSVPKDAERLMELFTDLEFKSHLQRLQTGGAKRPSASPPSIPTEVTVDTTDISTDRHEYVLIRSEADLVSVCTTLLKATKLVFDTETTSTDAMRAELVGISLCAQPRMAYYVPVAPPATAEHKELFPGSPQETDKGLPLDVVLHALKPLLEHAASLKVGHNIKYDMLVMAMHGVILRGPIFDTMVASYILRADGRHALDDVALEHLRYRMVSYDELTGTGKARKPLREVPVERVADYSCEDADMTYRLYEQLREKIATEGMQDLGDRVEFPLVAVLERMERAGVGIDVPYLEGMSKELERELDNLTRTIHREAGEPFNIHSTQQLGEVLFGKLKLRTVRKTKTGFSTDVNVLEELRHEHPIVEMLLSFRQLAKLKSTYVDALPKLVHPRTGRVHTSFNQTIAATGRLSSSDPNLQNIPIRTELGRSIRKAFITSSPTSKIVSADYSQIELRVMAHLSGDEGLAQAFRNGEDVHATTAAKVFGVDLRDVTGDMRRKSKEVNFGIMYGIGPFGLANRLEIPQTEAKDIIARYFDRFPKVRQYIHDTIASAQTLGYVATLLGRRRYLPDLRSGNQNIRSNAERQAINMPVQGTAADMIKLAMVAIDREIQSKELRSAMVLQVHDELVFDVEAGEEETMKDLVGRLMRTALPLAVPVEVEMGSGTNWLEAH